MYAMKCYDMSFVWDCKRANELAVNLVLLCLSPLTTKCRDNACVTTLLCAGNSILAAMDTQLSALDYVWPEKAHVKETTGLAARHEAIRSHMATEAKETLDGCFEQGNKNGLLSMSSLLASLFKGETISQQLCMLVATLCDKVVNVIQYSPGEQGLHVIRYGGNNCDVHQCLLGMHAVV